MAGNNTCMLCNTSCVGCSGGRCRGCKFNKKQVGVSNHFVKLGVPLESEEFVQRFKQLVRGNKTIDQIQEWLDNGMPEAEIVVKDIEPIEPRRPRTRYCIFPKKSLNMWDACIYCGESRFYSQGKICKVLGNEEIEINGV